jgi:hypothetical protein
MAVGLALLHSEVYFLFLTGAVSVDSGFAVQGGRVEEEEEEDTLQLAIFS